MTIGEQLNATADAMDALLTYANGVTGQEDTNIGDAVKTLCDGFGGGSDCIASGTITVSQRQDNLTIDTGLSKVNFIYYIKKNNPLNYGERSAIAKMVMYGIGTWIGLGTNTAGTGVVASGSYYTDDRRMLGTVDGGTINFPFVSSNGNGYFQPDDYDWIAF